ncbi:MAG: DUF4173 domain-containing protein, partial [Eubacteriaceae bacterium]|nr:DUF4173 domain-containing protein [Eubacteriaceae bacterium]
QEYGTAPGAEPGMTVRSVYTPPVRILYDLEARDTGFILPFAAVSVMMVFWGLFGGMRLGFTVSYLCAFGVISAYLLRDAARPDGYTLLAGALCVAMSSVFSFVSAQLNLWVLLMLFAMSLVYFTGLVSKRREDGDLSLITSCVYEFFRGAFGSIGRMFSSAAKARPSSDPGRLKVLKGVALAILPAALIISLLVSSDAAFEGLVRSFSVDITEDAFRLVLALVLSVFMTSYCWSLRKNGPAASFGTPRGADATVMSSFLWVICGIYAVYLFSQLAYFFSAFSGILPEAFRGEYMISEYARRGFFEMCWIAVINFVVVFRCASLFGKERMRGTCLGLCLFICGFTVLIAATALSKMALYISMLGMTYLRVVTSVFMVCLMLIFAALTVRLLKPGVRVARIGAVVFAAALLVMSFGNVNGAIASYDYSRYADGTLESIDVWHMYSLGDSGVEYLIKLAGSSDEEVALQARDALRCCLYRYWCVSYDSRGGLIMGESLTPGWYGWCASTKEAMELLEDYFRTHPRVLREETV